MYYVPIVTDEFQSDNILVFYNFMIIFKQCKMLEVGPILFIIINPITPKLMVH